MPECDMGCQPDWHKDDCAIYLPDVAEKDAPCADCGHIHTPHGCTGEPTASDLWAGVSVGTCDCIPIEDLEPDEYCDPDWRDPITRPIPPAKSEAACLGLCGEHHWLDRPESDTRECLICGTEVAG